MTRIRPDDDDAGHPICFEKFAQYLFHDIAVASRRVPHEDSFAIAHNNSSMKYIEMLARRREKNQITGLQISFEPRHCTLRHTFHTRPLWRESRHNIQNAVDADSRDSRH